jgi:glycine/D-amino acid oxidase-like deaminating enzyme
VGGRGHGLNGCLWLDQVGAAQLRAPLLKNHTVDAAIVGAGYTGLWTAYHLLKAEPSLKVALIERETAGFGASGRNGGWCSALFAAPHDKIARKYGNDAALAMQRAMIETVDEVGRTCAEEGIDCDFHKGGTLVFATAPAHVGRVQEIVADAHSHGENYEWLNEPDASRRIALPNLGAAHTPDCARIQPAKLARGLAAVVEDMGAQIFEQTTATRIEERKVHLESVEINAKYVVRATEGYTARLPQLRRRIAPLYSLMIATEPLPSSFWSEVGWHGRETFTDGRHLLIYAQRTADDRIAFGGRGAPYHFGSRIDPSFDLEPAVFDELHRVLLQLFPAASDASITHRWGGPLGVPRDWFSSVGLDRSTGLAWAGGYVGDGVSTANLAGRTLRDLILERETELTSLPWVGHMSRSWEPEPFRWMGINMALRTMAAADRSEERTGHASKRGSAIKRAVGI